ncbi:major facilitator superfamily domain-containing protein [Amylocarpus encephaloides]|uniref:Major facilitator superfamily domain-containing protein n=1 Tax=Amylocarpus encephaloides TaxID=45428 RepID=A0A9P8C2E7_9HELO|nr:major facilitator superfamily domain-containing protein [Amylocarpus encephaloides]
MSVDIERASSASPTKPWLLEYRSSDRFILATVCVAIFTDAFLYGVVVPVLPFSLRERSGVLEGEVQWWTSFIFAIFGAAIIIGSPICGWIADRTSDRSVTYFAGLFILAAATLLFGLAKAAWLLVLSRLFQGLSAAVVYTVGLALLVDTVGRENIGQWMGTALSCSSIGLIISPLLGGIVYQRAGYMAVFGMALGLIVVDIVLRMSMIEKRSAQKYLKQAHSAPSSPQTGGIASPVDNESTALLPDRRQNGNQRSNIESQVPPIITLLGSPRVLAAIYGIFVNVSILATFDGVLPLFVKETFHWKPLAAGLIFLCIAIPALSGPIVGKLSDRLGPRWVAVAGCSLAAVPLILMRLVETDTHEQKLLLCWLLVACGCTLILIVAPVAADLSAVVEELEKEDSGRFGPGGAYAQAYALFNCSMAAATMFGPVVAAAIKLNYGWKAMTLAMGIFSFSGAIPILFFTGGWLFQDQERSDVAVG